MINLNTDREKAIADFSWACGLEEGVALVVLKLKERSVNAILFLDKQEAQEPPA